jgi:hypothetical protein
VEHHKEIEIKTEKDVNIIQESQKNLVDEMFGGVKYH